MPRALSLSPARIRSPLGATPPLTHLSPLPGIHLSMASASMRCYAIHGKSHPLILRQIESDRRSEESYQLAGGGISLQLITVTRLLCTFPYQSYTQYERCGRYSILPRGMEDNESNREEREIGGERGSSMVLQRPGHSAHSTQSRIQIPRQGSKAQT